MKPLVVIILVALACVIGYVCLSMMTTQDTLDEAEETGGWEGILLSIISPSVGFSVWIWPIVFLGIGILVIYFAYGMVKKRNIRKNQYWRK